MCTTNVHINYDFILSRSLNNPNLLYMWYADYQNKKLNMCMLNSFRGFHLCIKYAIMWYPDNQLKKKLNLCMYCKQIKTSLHKSNKNTKYALSMYLSMKNDIYLLR